MKGSLYIAIVKNAQQLLSGLTLDDEFFIWLNEIRKSHVRYRKEATFIALYPNHSTHGRDGYRDLRPIGEQLVDECKAADVKPLFREINYKNNGKFIVYLLGDIDITDLINLP